MVQPVSYFCPSRLITRSFPCLTCPTFTINPHDLSEQRQKFQPRTFLAQLGNLASLVNSPFRSALSMVIRFMASHCNFFSFALQSIPSASNVRSQSTLATTSLTRTTGESVLVSRLHHACIESARTHPLLAASFIRKAALTDDGSHRRKRCLTCPPHMS